MEASVLKKTRESLGKVIRKPPLTDKLLSKPPFRFLHDIITEVIRTTGFMKGLYSETESKSENVKDREPKMAFLQKAIDVVAMVTGEVPSARAARIVAGHEPERTNELLQTIALCCLNKVSSDDAVRRVLLGEKPRHREETKTETETRTRGEEKKKNEGGGAVEREGKERREKRDRERGKERERGERERGEREKERDRGERDRGEREKERERGEKEKETERGQREKERERGERRGEKERGERREEKEKGERGERREEKEREKGDRQRGKERERHREREEKEKERERHKEKEEKEERGKGAREKQKEREEKEREKHKEREDRERRRRDKEQDRTRSRPEEEEEVKVKTEEAQIGPEEPAKVTENSARIPRPSSAKGQRRRAVGNSQDDSDSEADADAAQKHPEVSTEATTATTTEATAQRRSVRPSSARAAPPRVRKQDETSADRLPSARVAVVILDAPGPELQQNDEDEQFLVQEAVTTTTEETPPSGLSSGPEAEGDATHGVLVKKILETKKIYEASPTASTTATSSKVSDARLRDLVQREMVRLQGSVQDLCRSALPLGKIMDYLQEDVDSMNLELTFWREEKKRHEEALQEENSLTEVALAPLRSELSDLEQLIQEQQSQICLLRCSVLRNEQRINKMLTCSHGNS